MAKISGAGFCFLCIFFTLLTAQLATAADDPNEPGYHTGLGATPTSGYAPLTVSFSDGGSYSVDQSGAYPVFWEWDLDDGTIVSKEEFSHTYYYPGTYYPTAEVEWSDGEYTTGSTLKITVKEAYTQAVTSSPTYYPEDSYDVPSDRDPDLTSSELWIMPDSVNAGDGVTVTSRIINLGGRDVNTVIVRYYLSTDQLFDWSDTDIGEYSINAPAGFETYKSQMLIIPEGTPGGSYYIIEVIDPDQRVMEKNEDDNSNSKPIKVIGIAKEPTSKPEPVITQITPQYTPQITYTPVVTPAGAPRATYLPTYSPAPIVTATATTLVTSGTPQTTPTGTPAIVPEGTPAGEFSISVSPADASAYAGKGLDYTLTITADPGYMEPVYLYLEIDAVITSFHFDLGRVDPPYPKSVVRTVPIPSYLPGGVKITGHVIGESGGEKSSTIVYLTILGTDVSLPESIMLSGAAAIMIVVGSLLGLSAAGLSSSLANVQAAQSGVKSDSGSSEKYSIYADRVTGVVWRKEKNFVWTGVIDTEQTDTGVKEEEIRSPGRVCSCGHTLSDDAEYCGFCGKKIL